MIMIHTSGIAIVGKLQRNGKIFTTTPPPVASAEVGANSAVGDPVAKSNLKKPESDEFNVDD
jgi:hypothetical protein